MSQDIQKPPPHSIEAEQGVLGSMLISPQDAIGACIAEGITCEYFYVPAHQTLFNILVELWTDGAAIDLITFTEVLRNRRLLDDVGGPAAVTNLYTFVPTASNIGYYARIVEDKYILRSIIAAGTEAVRRAYEEQDEPWETLSLIQSQIGSIGAQRQGERKSLRQLVDEKMESMQRHQQTSDILKTGLAKLDYNSPVRKGDMPILSGETKSGKSMAALSIAKNVAETGVGVGIFALESPAAEAVNRLLAGACRISQSKLDHVTNLSSEEIDTAMRAATSLAGLPIHLYDDIFDLHHIVAECRRLKAQQKVGLIIVDYAQLVRTPASTDKNREQEVALISRTIRLLALELKIPIILISQLNEDGRSRESRAIENDCTAFWRLDRDHAKPPDKNLRFWRIPIQRNGASPVEFPVTFLGDIGRVENCANEEEIL